MVDDFPVYFVHKKCQSEADSQKARLQYEPHD